MLRGRVLINVIPVLRNRIKQLEWESEIAETELDRMYAKEKALRLAVNNIQDPQIFRDTVQHVLAS